MNSQDIRSQAKECLANFVALLELRDDLDLVTESGSSTLHATMIEDQCARFKMWAGNIGALADGRASLDHRLRESEETKELMVEFLSTLSELLSTSVDIVKPGGLTNTPGRKATSTAGTEDLMSDTYESSTQSSVSAFQGTDTDSVQDEVFMPVSTFHMRLQGIERTIDRLYRLSFMIRQPSVAGQNVKADRFVLVDEEGNDIGKTFVLNFALPLVNHRFTNASSTLRTKLAEGIALRRKRFLYRQRHQMKLKVASTTNTMDKASDNGPTIQIEPTVRAAEDNSNGRYALPVDANFQMRDRPAPSQTSASAITKRILPLSTALEDQKSNHSSTFTNVSVSSVPLEIPPPPKCSPGTKEFECPYCCLMLPLREAKPRRWRRHILEDLEPYTCVFEECSHDNTLFKDRASWKLHLQAHRTRWVCTSQVHPGAQSFSSEHAYQTHMRMGHKGRFTEAQLPLLIKRSRVPASATFQRCPLCALVPDDHASSGEFASNPEQTEKARSDHITRHLAAHLEALAVKALPWQDVDDDESEVSSRTKKTDHITARSAESPIFVESPDVSLQFPQEEEELDLPPLEGEGITPPPDSSYEQDWWFIERSPYSGHARDEILQPLLRRLFLDTTSHRASLGPKLPVNLAPVSEDKSFFGRMIALDAIQQSLCSEETAHPNSNKPISFPRCFTLHGPGGMGKTQIAARFVSQHKSEFDAVLWVHAENSSKIAQDYREIAVSLGLVDGDSMDAMDLEYTRDIVKRWLVNPQKHVAIQGDPHPEMANWLLIFDGVENGDVLNDFWPYNGPGSVLVTSRSPYSWSTSLELKPWDVRNAAEYLFRLTGRQSSIEEKAAATAIANRLGGLPLALSQMGGIIMHQNLSFAQFLQKLEKQGPQDFLDWRLSDASEYSVASIWALDLLEHGKTLLDVLSLLDSDAIPEALFTLPASDRDSSRVRQLKADYSAARTELLTRSLITENRREGTIFVHKLVQEVSRSRMRQYDVRHNFLMCANLLCGKWPFELLGWRQYNARWAECEQLLPHVMKLKDLFPSIAPSYDSFEEYEFAKLLVDVGRYIYERGGFTDAVLFNNMAQLICESLKLRMLEAMEIPKGTTVALDHINYSLVEITYNRGCISQEVNEPVEALTHHILFNKLMIKECKDSGTEDIRLGISWNELGSGYMLNGNWKKGEECYLQAIAEMRKLTHFTPTHISLPLANLGLSYWLQGDFARSISVLDEGLGAREEEFGHDDRVSFITGRFLCALGNVKSNVEYHKRALEHYKSTLGIRHRRTADLFTKVAEHGIILGQFEIAITLLDDALEGYSSSPTFMPEKTRAVWMRHKALKGVGRLHEAQNELLKCFQMYSRLERERPYLNLEAKKKPDEIDDPAIDRLIPFWSK
ncbi:hypothetical protein BDV96DRAFT_687329 [Lophiotrema nucula]|uniref:Uncharacterized protein n=1 Tax=Lophiotrema nucula TaxID=690887 RepID=A0A6A5ZAG0_9PLEO|nr:hypothetical protein BDV96DRAFT_687329 [Lophiotrema nucula]